MVACHDGVLDRKRNRKSVVECRRPTEWRVDTQDRIEI